MLINRNHPGRGTAGTCPHCGQGLAGQLVHLEGLRFLCYQCLREIHAERRQLIRLSLLRPRRNRHEPAVR
jgi:hypothetical protein